MDFIQSDIIVEASALIDELREDIAAEKIAATISPFMPSGRPSIIKLEKTSLLFIVFPS